ncbi:lipase family protein [Saccharothrix sp. Mg75]|uniref:lipase family protein n=1 Tax=Saccharothrix sp. Mg75 TaxID=3445357 RepID=UPI003EEC9F28
MRVPGAVLDRSPLPARMWPDGASDAVRVVYQGLGYDGTGRRVSGSVFLPRRDAPPGGWPVVAYAHGTTGLADHCAPSEAGLSRLEREHVGRWLVAGYAVAATDYEGLATPGPHPYFNGEAVADDVVDAVRAARRLDPRVGRTWFVAGFSQGGHAALFTGLMATGYAPELDFRGTLALAPPVHLPLLVDLVTTDGTRPLSVLLPFLLAGVRASHPDFDARPLLTAAGGRLLDVAASASLVDMFRAVARLTNDDGGTTGLPARPGVDPVLRACRVPVSRMDRPVYLTAGTADEVVPLEVVERFAADLARAGTVLRFDRHAGAAHADVLAAGHDDLVAWTDALLERPPDPVPRSGPFDADGDGVLTADDYEVFALRLVQAFGEPPGSPKALAVRHGYRALWRGVADRSDTDLDGRVSRAEFLRWLDDGHHDGFEDAVRPLAEAVLALADTGDGTGDGTTTTAELTRLLTACGLSPARAAAVLTTLDGDGGGTVSTAEVVDAVRDFCLDPVPGKPGDWLFGRR